MSNRLGIRIAFSFLTAFLAGDTASAAQAEEICRHLRWQGDAPFELNKNEMQLICGAEGSDAWRRIPISQKRFHMKTFLSLRGYYRPEFQETDEGDLIVSSGPLTRISELVIDPEWIPVILPRRLRKVLGQPMTTEYLDRIEDWTTQRLKNQGYACATVKTRAIQETGQVQLELDPGRTYLIPPIEYDGLSSKQTNVLERFRAFRQGKLYTLDLFTLTSRRLENDGLVLSSAFATRCSEEELRILHKVVYGPSRMFRFGVGASTEEIPLLIASWRNTNLGRNSSAISVSGTLSSRRQEIKGLAEYHPLSEYNRFFVEGRQTIARRSEPNYTTVYSETAVLPGYRWDTMIEQIQFKLGPQYHKNFSTENLGQEGLRYLSAEAQAEWTHHDYEFNAGSPRQGGTVSITSSIRRQGFISPNDLKRYLLTGSALFNFKNYDPPLLVFGVRAQFGTGYTPDRPGPGSYLLPTDMFFLGGDDTLRGFGRQELPFGGQGSLTSLYLGFEVRLASTLPAGIEPFVFLDYGILGAEPSSFDRPRYYSPGLGVRWQTPFGTIRGTFAHGIVTGMDLANENEFEHPQIFVSFGKEF